MRSRTECSRPLPSGRVGDTGTTSRPWKNMALIRGRSGVASAHTWNASGCDSQRAVVRSSRNRPALRKGGGLMDGRILSDRRGSVVPLRQGRHREMDNSAHYLEAAETSDGHDADIVIGSDNHKTLFCRMLLDTFCPYKPESIVWPNLDEEVRRRLCALPIWDIAVQTEGKACLRVLSYGEAIKDPLLQRALRLNAFEEARHKRLLKRMVSSYGIK